MCKTISEVNSNSYLTIHVTDVCGDGLNNNIYVLFALPQFKSKLNA